jgi:uncharacterized protein (UPF0179 family)
METRLLVIKNLERNRKYTNKELKHSIGKCEIHYDDPECLDVTVNLKSLINSQKRTKIHKTIILNHQEAIDTNYENIKDINREMEKLINIIHDQTQELKSLKETISQLTERITRVENLNH